MAEAPVLRRRAGDVGDMQQRHVDRSRNLVRDDVSGIRAEQHHVGPSSTGLPCGLGQ